MMDDTYLIKSWIKTFHAWFPFNFVIAIDTAGIYPVKAYRVFDLYSIFLNWFKCILDLLTIWGQKYLPTYIYVIRKIHECRKMQVGHYT